MCLFVANAHTLPGLTTWTAQGNEAAAVKINGGINQSTGWHRRLKINGCSRSLPSSGSRPHPTRGIKARTDADTKDDKRSIFRAISFLGDRGGSPAIRSDDRTTLHTLHLIDRVTRRISHICRVYRIYGIRCMIFIGLLRELSHSCTAKEAKNRLSRVHPVSLK